MKAMRYSKLSTSASARVHVRDLSMDALVTDQILASFFLVGRFLMFSH
jgi:hypothetical protein